jgi:hypothetical protein
MKIFWSPSNQGFFGRAGIYADGTVPDDLVPVELDLWQAMISANERGSVIVNGPENLPVAIAPPPPSIEADRLSATQRVKQEAARRIEAILPLHKQINALREFTPETDAAFIQIDEIRHASNLIELDIAESEAPAAVPIATHPLWPDHQESKA